MSTVLPTAIIVTGGSQDVLTVITRTYEQAITQPASTITTTVLLSEGVTDVEEYSSLQASEASASRASAATSNETSTTLSSPIQTSSLSSTGTSSSPLRTIVIVVTVVVVLIAIVLAWWLIRRRQKRKQKAQALSEPRQEQQISQLVETRHVAEKASRMVEVTEEVIEVTPPRKTLTEAERADRIERVRKRSPGPDYGFGPVAMVVERQGVAETRHGFGPAAP